MIEEIISYKPNTILKLEKTMGMEYAKFGSLAVVVDGKDTYPELYQQLISKIGEDDVKHFTWVKWVGNNSQQNGAYMTCRFKEVKNVVKV